MAAPASGMMFAEYAREFTRVARRWRHQYRLSVIGRARSVPRSAPLLRLRSVRPRKGGVMVMAGFHGEEPAGPLCLLHYLDHILARALDYRVPLVIYPVVNPYGFDHLKRTTVDGQYTNAGFVHDEDLTGPEVALLRADMVLHESEIFLDLHEDDREVRSYLYSFGDPALARSLVDVARSFLPIADGPLSHTPTLMPAGGEIRDHHDGTAEDFMHHQGARASFALETPARVDMRVRQAVHLGFIEESLRDVAARKPLEPIRKRSTRSASQPPAMARKVPVTSGRSD